jgi:hypothetical protein
VNHIFWYKSFHYLGSKICNATWIILQFNTVNCAGKIWYFKMSHHFISWQRTFDLKI